MRMRWRASCWVAIAACSLGSILAQEQAQGPLRVRLEIQSREGLVVIEADRLDREAGGVNVFDGQVVITYQDTVLKADHVVHDPVLKTAHAEGNVDVRRGLEWLKASRGDIDLETRTGTFYDVDGFTDQEVFFRAKVMVKTGPDTYTVQDGILTACNEALPKWSFRIGRAKLRVDSWARTKNTIFRIKNVPVFYLPYLIFPTGKRERQSGLLLPSTGNSSNKGRRISQSFYLTLGESTDLTYTQDYFSERGFGYGFLLRSRPNQFSSLQLDGYAVDDRLGQGGAILTGEGETRFSGFRAVTDFSFVSSFEFRQVFSDNFFTATRPDERSILFMTRNQGPLSFNFAVAREETAFPGPNVIFRTFPSAHFRVHGKRLFDFLYADLDASAEGLNREDGVLETPGLTQRFDFFPQVYFSAPIGDGLRVTPRLGLRQTFYSDSRSEDSQGNPTTAGDNFTRRYLEFTLDLKGWGLAKIYRDDKGQGRFKHVIEPAIRYRYLTGIDDFDRTLIFDEVDAVANTNEVELSLFNRFLIKRNGRPHEWLSVKLAQKFFFNEDFSGALREGRINQFYPLNTTTGFQYAALLRNSSPLTTVVRITPQRRISFDVRTDFDPDFERVRNFSITGSYGTRNLYLGTTYFTTKLLEPGTFQRNQLQGQISVGRLERGASLSGLFSYDIRSDRFLNYRARVNYFWDCCGVSLEYQGFSLGGDGGSRVRDERQIRFSFFLKGIGFFGNIERPNRIF